jgi:hypothetical protein
MINLMDNAIEAMERRGQIVVETQLDAANSVVRVSWPTTGRAFPRVSARSCSFRTTRPSVVGAALGWPSFGASSPNTVAASRSATTRRAGHGLLSNYHADMADG